jgi:opacity protein-like surface antigen
VRIDDKDFVILNDVGDFGYVAKHDEPVTKWSFGFSGARLQRINDLLYLIDVAPGEEAEVETVISANEGAGSGAWRIFLDAGPNFPHGDFGRFIDGRLSVNAGLEGFLAPNTSIEGILGYHSFKTGFGFHPRIWQLSANVKQYFGPGPLHFFINGGAGAYRFDPGSTTKFGANAGAGLLYDVSATWGFEGVYNFHAISTSGSNTEFSTVQVGIRHRLF